MSKKPDCGEFLQFLASKEEPVPSLLSRTVLQAVRQDLQPSLAQVCLRLIGIHLVAAGITLTFCPQFGVGPLGGGNGVMGWFMAFGPTACALFCGALFMGTTVVVSQIFLSNAHRRLVVRNGLWQFPALAVLSMVTLMLIGGQSSDATVLFWFAAAVLSGVGLFGMLERLRSVIL